MDIVVAGNSQLQWSIIGSDMPSALGLVIFHTTICEMCKSAVVGAVQICNANVVGKVIL